MTRPGRGQRGAVTAELAMAMPLLLALTVGLFWILTLAADQVRLQDAATQIARAVARGDEQSEAVTRGLEIAPSGAQAAVTAEGPYVRVIVDARSQAGPGLLARVGRVTLQAEATALLETTSGQGSARVLPP